MEIRPFKQSITLAKILLTIAIFALGSAAGYFYATRINPQTLGVATPQSDKYVALLFEAYDLIKESYWDKIDDEQLVSLFVLGTQKLTNQPQSLKQNSPESLEKMLASIITRMGSDEEKKEFTTQLADVVLANLQPLGRNRLYSRKEEQELSNNVQNINPEVNYYQNLGVDKNASQEEIEAAYERLLPESDPGKSAEIAHAYEVLKDPAARALYDETGIEPTLNYQLVRPDIFYIHIKRISPTTLDELKRVTEKVDNQEGLDSLILDLRDNIGGSIDILPYLLGPFIGPNQYAYQFFHQGETTDFKTKTGWLPSLVRYKKVVVLINEGTQSSAEVMAAALKKYNVGIVVGVPTKGWGTVEKVFPLQAELNPNERYSAFLVHSLTLRDDNQPIESNKVEPVVNIDSPNWEKELSSYFHYDELVQAVKEVWAKQN